jgi:hypothetical protein
LHFKPSSGLRTSLRRVDLKRRRQDRVNLRGLVKKIPMVTGRR